MSASLSSSGVHPEVLGVNGGHGISPNGDHSYDLPSFRRNIGRCKIALECSLSAALVTGALHFFLLWSEHPSLEGWVGPARRWADAAILVLTALSAMLLAATVILRPFPAPLRPADYGGLANMTLHRATCASIFLFSLLSVIAHTAPGIAYIVVYHRAAPNLPADTRAIGIAHVVAIFGTLVAAGCMRRGPRLRATEFRVGGAFGLRDASPPKPWWEENAGQDVVDYSNCSMLTFLTLGYSIALARKSREMPTLNQDDLPTIEEWVRSSGDEYLEELVPEGDPVEYTSFGLINTLWGSRIGAIFITFVLETLNTVLSFVQVGALYELIASFGPSDDYSYQYLLCASLFVGQAIELLLSAYLWVRENYVLHNPVRFTMSSILYSKILRSTDAKALEAQHLTDGDDEGSNKGRAQVMNLLTMDTTVVASMATQVWSITNGLVRLAIGLVFLYGMLGISAVVALLCIPLVTPISVWIAKKSYECDKSWTRARDARTGAIKEFLMGVKVIKLNAFEDYEVRRVSELRDVETRWQRWRYTLGTLFNIVADQMPNFAMLLTFVFYTKVLGETLEPATAFVAITVFLNVRSGLDALPGAIDAVLTCKIALDRLKGFLNQPEVKFESENISGGHIIMDNATVSWPSGDGEGGPRAFRLTGLNFSLPVGAMTLVCGPLGSGKTLFLRALLGEANVDSGRVIGPRSTPNTTPIDATELKLEWNNESWAEDSVAYAPQAAYIRHGTIRDNIVFGQPFWEERYQAVIAQCSLVADLHLMMDGDMTEVGENGVNLSGGQKARINLARCVYSRAQTIYLDDILSAVDAHTAQHIVSACFKGELLRGRTLVLVSHHVDICLPASEYVVALDAGHVQQACRSHNAKLTALRALASPKQETKDLPETVSRPASPDASLSPKLVDTLHELHTLAEQAHMPMVPSLRDAVSEHGEIVEANHTPRVLYQSEHQSHGHVASAHYWMLIKAAGGPAYWLLFAILYLGTQGTAVLVSWVLQWWTADPAPDHLDYYLALYISANLTTTLLGGLRWVWLYGIGNVGWYSAGTKKIHRKLFATIANAPLSYFETTPAGRILNLFGQDVRRLDAQSADDFGRTTTEFLRLLAAAIVVGWETPAMLLVLVAFGVPLFLVANSLGKLRTNLRRLAAVADSPLISQYHDSIDGVVMLRAFGLQNVMTKAMRSLLTRSRTAETWNWIVYNWVRAVVLTLSSVFMTATAALLVGRDISASQVGFILSFAAQISGNMFSLLEQFILLEQTFVSAERIAHIIEDTPQESKKGAIPPASWPTLKSGVVIEDLKVRYAADLPDVLSGVSFTIEPGHRVGIVGSTGSGKSTLALSLFRAVDAHRGRILIDGVDISDVALHELRSRLNMVAQDGTLPSGTLRRALDVSGERNDADIYDALRRVHLLPSVSDQSGVISPFADLDTFVAPEGANFSHGQRQLLCLARALLKDSRILVMDEATSSVDFDTDAKITQTIRECFTDTTMIVIAHRLATIVGYDRVLVLDRGRVAEYDSPIKLMKQEGSAFRGLCMANGEDEFDNLLKLAKSSARSG